jgi:hypothetical protein
MNICPICGYKSLEFPPIDYTICACCGTEFGYDDRVLSHTELTKRWVDNGCPWFDDGEQKPLGWNAYMQLSEGGFRWALPKLAVDLEFQANLFVNQQVGEKAEIQLAGQRWNFQLAA